MNFIYLSPHFPPNYFLFCVRLKELGANVLGLADEPYEILRPELKNSLTEYYRVNDLHNYDELIRAFGYFTHKYGKIDRIDSLNEYWLETEAALRTDFNITGIKNDEIVHAKRKSEMKKFFEKASVKVAKGTLIRSDEDAWNFIAEVGLPVIAKPDIGVGAAKTYQINDEEQMQYFLADRPGVDYFIEEYVSGIIQTFDGLTDQDGNIVFSSSMQYSQGIMETVNSDDDIYYYILREIPKDLEKFGKKTVEAFGIKERFFHIEYFRTQKNNIVALEVNLRPPGGLTTDMFNYANDIDIYYEWANIVMNNCFSSEISRDYYCAYVGRKSNKLYIHSHSEIINNFSEQIANHESISGVFSVALGNYGYIVRSPELPEIFEIAEYIQAKK